MAVLPTSANMTSANLSESCRVLTSGFGDGYEQRFTDGLNMIKQTFNVTYTDTSTNINTIYDFLKNLGGVDIFQWTPPRQSTELDWTCAKWSRKFVGSDVDQLTATFIQVFDL